MVAHCQGRHRGLPLRTRMQTTIFKTKWGWIGLAATPKGVSAVVLPKLTRLAAELELNGRGVIYHAQDGRNKLRPYTEQSANGTGVPSGHLRTAQAAIVAYLAGKARSFALPLDWGDHSPFQM